MPDRPKTPAPWDSLPGDKDDPNYGRECVRCGGAVRAGGRYAHVCAPTHPETASMRLAEAATEASAVRGPWRTVELDAGTLTRVRAPDGLMYADVWAWHSDKARQALAAHIAHAHPGRVKLWLRCVGALRRHVARGHALNCKLHTTRPPFSLKARAEWVCDCGHEEDKKLLEELATMNITEG